MIEIKFNREETDYVSDKKKQYELQKTTRTQTMTQATS